MFLRPWRNAMRLPGFWLAGLQTSTLAADALIGGAFIMLTIARFVVWVASSSSGRPFDSPLHVALAAAVWFGAALHLLFATGLEAARPPALSGSRVGGDSRLVRSMVLARVDFLFYGDAHVAAACAACLFVPLRDVAVAAALDGSSGGGNVFGALARWAHALAWGSWLLGLPLSVHQLSPVAWPMVVLAAAAGAPGSPCRVNFGARDATGRKSGSSSSNSSSSSSSSSSSGSSSDDGLLGGLLDGCGPPSGNSAKWGAWGVLSAAGVALLCAGSCCYAATAWKMAPPQRPLDADTRGTRSSVAAAWAGFALRCCDGLGPLSALLLVALYPLPALALSIPAALAAIAVGPGARGSNGGGEGGQGAGLRARAAGGARGGAHASASQAAAESTDSWAGGPDLPNCVAEADSATCSSRRFGSLACTYSCSSCGTSSGSGGWSSVAGHAGCAVAAVAGQKSWQKLLWPLAYGPGATRRARQARRGGRGAAWWEGPPLHELTLFAAGDALAQQRAALAGALREGFELPYHATGHGGGIGGGSQKEPSGGLLRAAVTAAATTAGKRGGAGGVATAQPLPAFFSSGAVRVPPPPKPRTPHSRQSSGKNPPKRRPSFGAYLQATAASPRTGSEEHFFQFKPSKAHWQVSVVWARECEREREDCWLGVCRTVHAHLKFLSAIAFG
jgi:hypothetical protein